MRRLIHTGIRRARQVLGDQRGIALVLTLLVVALLTALVVQFDFRTRLDLRMTGNYRDSVQAGLLAESAVEVGKQLLKMDQLAQPKLLIGVPADRGYDINGEPWGQAATFPLTVPAGAVSLAITDEDGKLNLNDVLYQPDYDRGNKQVAVFHRLLEILEVDAEEARVMEESLLDWLDPNATDCESYYQSLEPPYRCGEWPLRTYDELGLVRGFTPEMLALLAPYVTVIWEGQPTGQGQKYTPGKININTASVELLMALDGSISREVAEDIVASRDQDPFTGGKNVGSQALLQAVPTLGQDVAQSINDLLKTTSDHFSVTACGEVGGDVSKDCGQGGGTVRTVHAVVYRPTGKSDMAQVLAWRPE